MDRFGQWKVERALNEDASVFACRNDAGQAAVAKIPRRGALGIGHRREEENRRVLAYEARQLATWRGIRGVVELIEWQPDAEIPYLVTALLGASLEDSIPELGLEPNDCFQLIVDVASALERIHALGDAHHDVKPDNLLRHHSGGWCLIDPCPADMATEDYGPSRTVGAQRDLIALSRVFITAYTGAMETELPHEVVDSVLDLPEGERWLGVLRKLSRGGSSATNARRAAWAVLRTP